MHMTWERDNNSCCYCNYWVKSIIDWRRLRWRRFRRGEQPHSIDCRDQL